MSTIHRKPDEHAKMPSDKLTLKRGVKEGGWGGKVGLQCRANVSGALRPSVNDKYKSQVEISEMV